MRRPTYKPLLGYARPSLSGVAGEGEAGELAALVGVENLGFAEECQRFRQGRNTEARVHRVRQSPGEHLPGRPVHDGDHVQEAPGPSGCRSRWRNTPGSVVQSPISTLGRSTNMIDSTDRPPPSGPRGLLLH